jgi:hypothetical protein
VPADPSLAIAQAAASILGPLLSRCEERPAGPGQPPVCLVVVERDAAAARDRLRSVIEEAGERRAIEVLDRHAFETLQRLAAAGLVAFTSTDVRELHPAAEAPSTPAPLTATERARLQEFVETADRQLRLAEVLAAADFATESGTASVAAATALAGALAVAAHAEPPDDLATSLRGDALARWGAAGPAVQALAGSSAIMPDDLPAVLRAVLGALRKTQPSSVQGRTPHGGAAFLTSASGGPR